jgi:hypothetical protein
MCVCVCGRAGCYYVVIIATYDVNNKDEILTSYRDIGPRTSFISKIIDFIHRRLPKIVSEAFRKIRVPYSAITFLPKSRVLFLNLL